MKTIDKIASHHGSRPRCEAGTEDGGTANQPVLNFNTNQNEITAAVLRPAVAAAYLGISRTKLHILNELDPTFPRKIRFSNRCVGWRRESLDTWLRNKELKGV